MAVIKALSSGKPDDLIGWAESSWLDFKGSPYPTDNKGKFDICKDVAAFANAQGGLIVCGVKTTRDDNEARDIATSLHPFPRHTVKIESYKGVLSDYLWPRVDIDFQWFADPNSQDAGHYLVIEVEPIPEQDRYVIVRRSLNDKAQLADGFFIPERRGDATASLRPDAAYRLINEGYRQVSMPRSPSPVTPLLDSPSADPLARELATEGIEHMEQRQEWQDTPVLFWQSIPLAPVSVLPNLFGAQNIEGRLRNQDVLRPAGFNFGDRTGGLAPYAGGLYLDRTRCALWVRPDGSVTAGAVATPEMLCWAMEQRYQQARINSLVLTEMTLEYFRIADDVVAPQLQSPAEHRIFARRFQGNSPRSLGPGREFSTLFLSEARLASADMWDRSWRSLGDPERDAYEALRMVYALFGLDVGTNADVKDQRVPASAFREGVNR